MHDGQLGGFSNSILPKVTECIITVWYTYIARDNPPKHITPHTLVNSNHTMQAITH